MVLKLMLLWMICSCIVDIHDCRQKYRVRRNTKIKVTYAWLETFSQSAIMCSAYCETQPPCLSISFEEGTQGTCLLSYEETFEDPWDINMPYACENAVGWITMSKVLYPVIHLLGVTGPRYSLTFSDAQTVCRDYGTAIASPKDLLDARAAGYDRCGCGWLSDQTNGFVLQEQKSYCWGSFHTGILICGYGRADTYCKS